MIGNTMKEMRINKGLSLTELAEIAGVEESCLRSVEENHILYPSFEFLYQISPVLGVSADTFIFEGAKHTYDTHWDSIIMKALDQGLSTDEYLTLLKFTRKQETNKLQRPISHKLNKTAKKII
ncbi:XRE family transcriptional regulator [Anaerobacillus alkaliphilus]|uniref:XRE family transcriptional regulator n=1 Tax=Anaerobacillus alkaliphilus TaxID=1548597 RepID=A0A4Q0VSV5_9BACI|nr:helix-turn-helix domain-containing protein [Anaerobacillus alkaliphilus]RXJ01642.1 XRE family transcriptional regulator [Anaerobacillus alkaliphilus]